jgi:hypothetical protein
MREFEGGAAIVNAVPQAVTISLKRPMRRLRDAAAPRYYLEIDDDSRQCSLQGTWEKRSGETHYYGPGFRTAPKPGSTAVWRFTAPSTDIYTFYASVPGGANLTNAASYALTGQAKAQATISQRGCDGGWTRLFEARLEKGREYGLKLLSGGTGETAADAVRLESKARFNDGAVVDKIELGPLDGIVLLNK